MTDLLLKGGEVIDPSQDIRAKLDVAVTDGVISAVAPDIDPSDAVARHKCGRQHRYSRDD